MAAVRISVGAASDGSMRTVFKPMIEAAKEARAKIAAEFAGLGVSVANTFKLVPAAAQAAFAKVTAAENAAVAAGVSAVEKGEAQKRRAREKSERDRQRDWEKEVRDVAKRAGQVGYNTQRYFDRTLRSAGGIAMSVAKGAGVDLDIGSLVGKSVDFTKKATDLSNAAYQPNAANPNDPARTRVSASTIMSKMREAGNAAALDPTKALEGLQTFTGTTGDLHTGMEIIKDLGVLSRATGTNFEDMVAAAGEVSAKLGDIPNKGATVVSVMRAMAGQDKLGAVEIKDLSVQMAKLGAGASRFGQSTAESIVTMGAITQMARQQGGAKSASVAANAAMALVTGFTKGTTIKNLQKFGIQPFQDPGTGPGKNTKLLDPQTMILAMLMKSGGSQKILGQMINDKMAGTALAGFAKTYNDTKGTQTDKLNAVRAEFKKSRSAAMGEGEVKESFGLSMQTPEAKMQLFNNKMSEVGAEIAGKVLPALEQLAPMIIKGVDAFGKFVAWAAENPGKALAVALAGSIARAGIESVVRSGLESLLKSAAGAGGPGGSGSKLAGGLSTLGQAMTIVATAVAIEQVGELIIDKVLADKSKAQDASASAEVKALNAASDARAAVEKGSVTAKDKEAIDQEAAALDLKIRQAEAYKKKTDMDPFHIGRLGSAAVNYVSGGAAGESGASQDVKAADAENLANLKAALDKLHGEQAKMTAAIASGVIKVQVVGPGAPGVSSAGVTPGGNS